MAATYTGGSGKRYTVIEPYLGKGGEGAVYRIAGMPGYVLKVIVPGKRTEARKRKLQAMIKTNLPASAKSQVTWPVDVVFEGGQFAGYVMPEVRSSEDLNIIYSNKYASTFTERITIAMNLCAAINAVHNAGQVCGDLNPKNIQVDPKSAHVMLVDTDSYHIKDPGTGRIYRCEVGMPEYLPNEVQQKMKNGYRLDNAPLPTFSKQSDLFALAVHIFALLMNGCHPYACATGGKTNIGNLAASQPSVTCPQPIDNICNGFFPFYHKRKNLDTPKYAPEFDMLPKKIQAMFVRAFADGHTDPDSRPDTVAWYNALNELRQNVSTCSRNKSHIYPAHLKKCPWCEIENRMMRIVPANNVKLPTPAQRVGAKITGAGGGTAGAAAIGTGTKRAGGTTAVQVTTPPVVPVSRTAKGFANEKVFWTVTILVPIAIHLAIYLYMGNILAYAAFGYEYGEGMESIASNLGLWLGPWGFLILGLAGTYIYNAYWSTKGQLYGYRWYHYVLSVMASLAGSASWVLIIVALTLAVYALVAVLIGAVLCGLVSG